MTPTRALLRRFFTYYKPYKTLFFVDFGCAVVAGLLQLGFPLAVKYFIDDLLPGQNWTLILVCAAALLGIYIANALLLAIVNYWGHALGVGIETDMRAEAFDHLQKLSFRYFDNAHTGQIITHVTKDLEEVGEVAHHGPEDVFIAAMTFAAAFALMFSVHWKLALISAAIVPFMTWLVARYGSRMTENWERLFGQVGDFNTRIAESIGGIRVVKAFANEDHERALFKRDNDAYKSTKLAAYAYMTASITMSYLGTRVIQIIVMVAGAHFVIVGDLTYGGLIGFILLVDVFLRPIDRITAVLESYPKGIAGFRRYTSLVDTAPDIADRPDAVSVERLRGDIVYRDVGFSYGGQRAILNGFDLTISAGETVALVGPSGAGKTTICSLLPRFYDVTSGAISIDGFDIRNVTQKSLRAQIGIVQQDVFLFGASLRENIMYGKLAATDDELSVAVRRAKLDTFVAQLPDGLDTLVGERGVRLSGGQKQRVAIARIFLKNPPILILDEATSALDSETETSIQTSLVELSAGRTVLVIAHRLATVQHADRIVVVGDTGILEQGSHSSLLARDSAYARLHNAQFSRRW